MGLIVPTGHRPGDRDAGIGRADGDVAVDHHVAVVGLRTTSGHIGREVDCARRPRGESQPIRARRRNRRIDKNVAVAVLRYTARNGRCATRSRCADRDVAGGQSSGNIRRQRAVDHDVIGINQPHTASARIDRSAHAQGLARSLDVAPALVGRVRVNLGGADAAVRIDEGFG